VGDGTALPGWLSFNASTRTFSGTPPQDFNGTLDLKVTASDGALTAADTFTLTIGASLTGRRRPCRCRRSHGLADAAHGVLANDHDPYGDPLAVVGVSDSTGTAGTVGEPLAGVPLLLQRNEPLFITLADNAKQAVVAVDGTDLKGCRFADPQTAGVHDGKAGSVDRVGYAAKQPADFCISEGVGQALLARGRTSERGRLTAQSD
jgi:Putative Ig domain